jgi:hypothetical protein
MRLDSSERFVVPLQAAHHEAPSSDATMSVETTLGSPHGVFRPIFEPVPLWPAGGIIQDRSAARRTGLPSSASVSVFKIGSPVNWRLIIQKIRDQLFKLCDSARFFVNMQESRSRRLPGVIEGLVAVLIEDRGCRLHDLFRVCSPLVMNLPDPGDRSVLSNHNASNPLRRERPNGLKIRKMLRKLRRRHRFHQKILGLAN